VDSIIREKELEKKRGNRQDRGALQTKGTVDQRKKGGKANGVRGDYRGADQRKVRKRSSVNTEST
jgi:hypothetical protein